MILDVGGRRHKVLESNFNIYPNTRLGKLLTAKTESEILNLCDGYKPGDIPEFFFDRNWHSFNSILDIYRTGVLHLNTDLCALVLQKDLEYWQIDELILGKWDWKFVISFFFFLMDFWWIFDGFFDGYFFGLFDGFIDGFLMDFLTDFLTNFLSDFLTDFLFDGLFGIFFWRT